ncbi:MAG: aminopeptidase [Bacteroides sp. SM23_62_1]|nr:MAG: aminopeptidase [Bacteroides sp. SM23_62_1]
MKRYLLHGILFLILAGPVSLPFNAQAPEELSGYQFKILTSLPATDVKNQYLSSTCWSFSILSMLESELIRLGKYEYDLSEMFIVRHVYEEKAEKYVRMHGMINFSGGGFFHDVFHIISKYGIVPDEVYSGLIIGEENHVHTEMDKVLKSYVTDIIQNQKLTPVWYDGFVKLLDSYLGGLPEHFDYDGQSYTPLSFARMLDLNPDDYIQISSFTHHPFYEQFILEVPDNWAWGLVYNLPLDDMMAILYHAVENGYTISWSADISEKGFSWQDGVAVVPETDLENLTSTDREEWKNLTKNEMEKIMYSFKGPVPEKIITQEIRQVAFDNYTTTDDHGMHITGLAHDQLGNKYFLVKNSWGTTISPYWGYLYVSDPYVRYKTIAITVNKNAIPVEIKKKIWPE